MAKILSLWGRGRQRDPLTTQLSPHIRRLYRLAYRLTGNEADSEDLLQDLVVRLHSQGSTLAGLDQPGTWLARVLYRIYVDHFRRQRRNPLTLAQTSVESSQEDDVSGLAAVEATQPEKIAEQDYEARRLQAALDQLNEDQREVVMLHDVEGYSLPELQEILGLPLGTLKSRLHRGRHSLRSLLSTEPFAQNERVRG